MLLHDISIASLFELGFVLNDLLDILQVVFMSCCLLLAVMAVAYVLTRTKPVYLMKYHCYKAPDRSVFSSMPCLQQALLEVS